ncbi:hypothetical protein NDU88_000495 [Pleurodeles waltl]|uniref:Uncharacterized protein n=1 Tax=Pleurodeles waltl TaxID=8319 RepID=A0AAV7P4C8_PLEWA|nr:hypothetical protein NDU88_000495 [Pleurodeles waltl]
MEASIPSIRRLTLVVSCSIRSIVVQTSRWARLGVMMCEDMSVWKLGIYGGAPPKIVVAVPACQQREEGGKRNGQVEGCWQGGTASPAEAGAHRAGPVELVIVVSANPLRLGFRGRGSARSAGPLSLRRAAGPLVLQ